MRARFRLTGVIGESSGADYEKGLRFCIASACASLIIGSPLHCLMHKFAVNAPLLPRSYTRSRRNGRARCIIPLLSLCHRPSRNSRLLESMNANRTVNEHRHRRGESLTQRRLSQRQRAAAATQKYGRKKKESETRRKKRNDVKSLNTQHETARSLSSGYFRARSDEIARSSRRRGVQVFSSACEEKERGRKKNAVKHDFAFRHAITRASLIFISDTASTAS